MSTITQHVSALADAIHDGELDPEQREHLVASLHSLNTTATLAPRAQEHYPGSDAAALGYLIGTWAPVFATFTELAGTVPERCTPAAFEQTELNRGQMAHPVTRWVGRSLGQLQSNSPVRIPVVNADHAAVVNLSVGPVGFFESRTAWVAPRSATSTHVAPRLV